MIVLGSGGFRTPERVALWTTTVRTCVPPGRRLLFIPYALADYDGYERAMIERGLNAGYELSGIHRSADPVAAIATADVIFVGGGNTFRLLANLYHHRLLEPIRARVRAGAPYLGISAGTNVACPTIRTTNDMPIVQPASLDALGLVPFQINPHYYTGSNFVKHGEQFVEHFGETRDDRIREFHEENDTPVIALWEGGILRIDAGRIDLLGAPARVFRRQVEARDLAPGIDLAPWLA